MSGQSSGFRTAERKGEIDGLVERLPRGSGDMAFDEPWQLRAFALVIAAHNSGQYKWTDFQDALIASIKEWESENGAEGGSWSYFEHWVNAVEAVLNENALVDGVALDLRVRQALDTPVNRNHHEPHYEPVAVDPGIGQTSL